MEKAVLIYNPCFKDERGVFAPVSLTHKANRLEVLNKEWLQSNVSYNPNKGTLRGMHLQLEPYAQTKLVKVINGSIIDFVIDLRPDSETHMEVQHFYVNNDCEVYVPRGYAHGFITIEDNTVVQYLVDNTYSKSNERSIKWDTIIGIKDIITPLYTELIISDKDQNAVSLTDHLLEVSTLTPDEVFEWEGKTEASVKNSNTVAFLTSLIILISLVTLTIFNLFK